MTFKDLSGQPPSRDDIEEARRVVTKFLITAPMKLPPELVVQLPNILRCLTELEKHVQGDDHVPDQRVGPGDEADPELAGEDPSGDLGDSEGDEGAAEEAEDASTEGEGRLEATSSALVPVVKWCGSKRWAAQRLADRVTAVLAPGRRYFEPFLGSGAVALAMPTGTPMVLADYCAPLSGLWWWIRNNPEAISTALSSFAEDWTHTEANYYRIRDHFRADPFSTKSALPAARFLWLNRTSYNGVYRENAAGTYNVPWGKRKRAPTFPTLDELAAIAQHLKTAMILLSSDFGASLRTVHAGDVVFADPPYDDVFDDYLAGGFGPEGQVRLAKALHECVARGAHVFMTNSDSPRIRELYADFTLEPFEEPRSVSAKASSRQKTGCLLCVGGLR